MVAAVERLRGEIDEIMPGVIADRRQFHENPELGFQEFETAKIVAERLRSIGVEDVRTGIAVTGVTGLIRGGKGPGKVVLLRADMDALPIHEENDVPYYSKVDGKMHACGHDAHTAMLLGIARVLTDRKDEFAGTVKVLFQPAEEGGGGARVDDRGGRARGPGRRRRLRPAHGPGAAARQDLDPARSGDGRGRPLHVTIKGKGGHGAHPDRDRRPDRGRRPDRDRAANDRRARDRPDRAGRGARSAR